MQPLEIIQVFLEPLERAGFPYMVTGSVAAIFHGAPRITHDVDLVLDVSTDQADTLASLFPSGKFYCPPAEILAVELARPLGAHFNLIHHESAFKADVYPARDWLHRWGMERRKRFTQDEFSVWVAPIEYVIVRKLQFHAEGGSEKHLRDIQLMLDIEGDTADMAWIRERVAERGLEEGWRRIAPKG